MISVLQKQTRFTLYYFKALLRPPALKLATANETILSLMCKHTGKQVSEGLIGICPSSRAQHPPEPAVINRSGTAITSPAGTSQAQAEPRWWPGPTPGKSRIFNDIIKSQTRSPNKACRVNEAHGSRIPGARAEARASARHPEGPSPERALETLPQEQRELRENKPARKHELTHGTLQPHAVPHRNPCPGHLDPTCPYTRVLYFAREHRICSVRAVNMFYLVL